ncbi:MAG TPA: DEAD/DEAH box helicase family protein [Thermoanaerobaculia bacterium]|nr:DEAD/DEAH box helicase family protein [Thermoanaerobaculia bacterium]
MTDERVSRLVSKYLIPLFWRSGSVLGICDELNRHSSQTIHPNRIHSLLSGHNERSLNEATFHEIQAAAAVVMNMEPDAARLAEATAGAEKLWPLVAGSENVSQALAERLGYPVAVVNDLITRCGFTLVPHPPHMDRNVAEGADWSFQADAERICLRDLARAGAKIGMIVPTGGGKTRIALRIALRWLEAHPDGVVLWVTHQRNLREQARRELQQMLTSGDHSLPADSAKLLGERIDVLMVQKQLRECLEANNGSPLLAIVDEAHHAAAPTYQPIFDAHHALAALFLTATPNRTDELPLGIDQISYSITYRQLADRRVIVLPQFEEFRVPNFDWSPESVDALAEDIVERAASEFTKVLVLAPRVDRVVEFYNVLRDKIGARDDHPLTIDDVGYIHGSGNSHDVAPEHFLATFREKPRAIYVSAQLLLEGFDDPTINAVVISYPSQSLVKLMQAAGRCVRYSPEKRAAFVVQARSEALEYYFDQRWLYQEISDRFRPELLDITYASTTDLREKVAAVLQTHNVDDQLQEHVIQNLDSVAAGQTCRLLFTGLPYFGEVANFPADARWTAFLETEANSTEFRWIFNDFCARGTEAADPIEFLRAYGRKFSFGPAYDVSATWRRYSDVLTAIHNAAQELKGAGASSADGVSRPYGANGATTWLRYITFRYDPVIDPELAAFLADCYNVDPITARYIAERGAFGGCVKLLLPGGGYEAHLLVKGEDAIFREQIGSVRASVLAARSDERFAVFAASVASLRGLPAIPRYVIDRLDQFINDEPRLLFLFERTSR